MGPTRRLLTSLATLPAPGPPTWSRLALMASSTGMARARCPASPPIIMVSVPASAPAGPPETGASMKPSPFSAARAARRRETPASEVEVSTKTAPAGALARNPSGASTTFATTSAVGSEAMTTSLAAKRSARPRATTPFASPGRPGQARDRCHRCGNPWPRHWRPCQGPCARGPRRRCSMPSPGPPALCCATRPARLERLLIKGSRREIGQTRRWQAAMRRGWL